MTPSYCLASHGFETECKQEKQMVGTLFTRLPTPSPVVTSVAHPSIPLQLDAKVVACCCLPERRCGPRSVVFLRISLKRAKCVRSAVGAARILDVRIGRLSSCM